MAKRNRFILRLNYAYRRISGRISRALAYWNEGIWSDPRDRWWITMLKVIHVSVRTFTDADLQTQACAMTYRTALAIVPALALLFAIGRGFGFQSLLRGEIDTLFPAQQDAFNNILVFVDSYLAHSSEGIFVGVGIVFLLWTLISLLSSVEDSLNKIFGVNQSRSMMRKIVDYTAFLLILPILMICGGGLTIFVSSSLQSVMHLRFMTPIISIGLEIASWIFTWLFFAAIFKLIPNTKVQFKNAFIAGIFTGTAFRVLEWIFVSGQLYVTKYNAIYGSFAFLPLLMIWVQLTWMAVLCGALLCYSSQNVFQYSFAAQIRGISPAYRRCVTLAVAAMVTQRFSRLRPAMTEKDISGISGIPPRLLTDILDRLVSANILSRVVVDTKHEVYGYQPALDTDKITVSFVNNRLDNLGRENFIPNFDRYFASVEKVYDELAKISEEKGSTILLSELPIDLVTFRQDTSDTIS